MDGGETEYLVLKRWLFVMRGRRWTGEKEKSKNN